MGSSTGSPENNIRGQAGQVALIPASSLWDFRLRYPVSSGLRRIKSYAGRDAGTSCTDPPSSVRDYGGQVLRVCYFGLKTDNILFVGRITGLTGYFTTKDTKSTKGFNHGLRQT